MATLLPENASETQKGRREARIAGENIAIGLLCGGGLALPGLRIGQHHAQAVVVGTACELALQIGLGTGIVAMLYQSDSRIRLGAGDSLRHAVQRRAPASAAGRIEFDRVVEQLAGFVELMLTQANNAQATGGVGVFRVGLQGRLEIGRGVAQLARYAVQLGLVPETIDPGSK